MTTRTRLINRRYRLERRTSISGTTETWLGFDNVLHRAVSVWLPRQELLRNGPFLVEFLQRSRIATALHHRGIVAAFDSGEDGDLPYLVSEYLGGESLQAIIGAESPFDVDDVAILIGQVAAALDYAHQRGFIHGSLTPEAVIVDDRGAAKLIGLGLPIGTIPVAGNTALTADDDIEALGAIAFEMLTGEEPHSVEVDSSGEAYLIDPDVPRNASDIVAIALGAGSVRMTSAGAFARSLASWRTFDPGKYFVAPEAPYEMSAPQHAVPPKPVHLPVPAGGSVEWDDAPLAHEAHEPEPAGKHNLNRWAALAVLLLALTAAAIVWRNNGDAVTPASRLSSQMSELAHLTGF